MTERRSHAFPPHYTPDINPSQSFSLRIEATCGAKSNWLKSLRCIARMLRFHLSKFGLEKRTPGSCSGFVQRLILASTWIQILLDRKRFHCEMLPAAPTGNAGKCFSHQHLVQLAVCARCLLPLADVMSATCSIGSMRGGFIHVVTGC